MSLLWDSGFGLILLHIEFPQYIYIFLNVL